MAKKLFEQGADVDPIGTNRVAHGKAGTATSNSTWDKIVVWLRTALSSITTRFVTDTQISTWDAKMEDTKAAIEAKLTGEITSHTHPSGVLNTSILNINDWDMLNNIQISIAHGLTFSKIRRVTVLIRNDNNDTYYQLDSPNTGGADFAGLYTIGTTNIVLTRYTGGRFDSIDFDSTSYNRGWLIIDYID